MVHVNVMLRVWTVRRKLQAFFTGYNCTKQRFFISLTNLNWIVNWNKTHANYTAEQLNNVIWSEETIFSAVG